jgi:hypothetical protein
MRIVAGILIFLAFVWFLEAWLIGLAGRPAWMLVGPIFAGLWYYVAGGLLFARIADRERLQQMAEEAADADLLIEPKGGAAPRS